MAYISRITTSTNHILASTNHGSNGYKAASYAVDERPKSSFPPYFAGAFGGMDRGKYGGIHGELPCFFGPMSKEPHRKREAFRQSGEMIFDGEATAEVKLTKEPYMEFVQSMQELIEARHGKWKPLDWDFMEEILFCYLSLNHRSVHRYIMQAFFNVMAVYRESETRILKKKKRSRRIKWIYT